MVNNHIFPIYFISLPIFLSISNVLKNSILIYGYTFIAVSILMCLLNLKIIITKNKLLIYLLFVAFTLEMLLFEYISIRDIVVMNINIAIIFFINKFYVGYKSYYNLIFISIVIISYLLLQNFEVEALYISYHDFGFFLCFNFLLYVLYEKNLNLKFLIINLLAILFLKGRTEIYIGISIFLYALKVIKIRKIKLIFMSMIFFSIVILSYQIEIELFPDLRDRAFSFYNRSDIYKCVYDNYKSFLELPKKGYVDECIRLVWIRNEGAKWKDAVISYENSYFLLFTKLGFMSIVLLFLHFYSICKSYFNYGSFFSIILLLFFVRSITGDLYFFTYRDFMLYYTIYIGLIKIND